MTRTKKSTVQMPRGLPVAMFFAVSFASGVSSGQSAADAAPVSPPVAATAAPLTANRIAYRRHPWVAASGATLGTFGTGVFALGVAIYVVGSNEMLRCSRVPPGTGGCTNGVDNPFPPALAVGFGGIVSIPFVVPGSILFWLGITRWRVRGAGHSVSRLPGVFVGLNSISVIGSF